MLNGLFNEDGIDRAKGFVRTQRLVLGIVIIVNAVLFLSDTSSYLGCDYILSSLCSYTRGDIQGIPISGPTRPPRAPDLIKICLHQDIWIGRSDFIWLIFRPIKGYFDK